MDDIRRSIVLDTLVSDFAGDSRVQQIGSSHDDLLAANVILIGSKHILIEDIHGNLVNKGMRDPCSWNSLA